MGKNNLNKKAVALEYNENYNAPKVTAKGKGYVAQRILENAAKNNIETYFDEDLLNSLIELSIGEEIPNELYDIVSKVLLYVEKIDKNSK